MLTMWLVLSNHVFRLDLQTSMQILGLDICVDIIVGNEMRRGISGGQKKRLTTGMCKCNVV